MKTESLQAGEDLAARGATHPRVSLDDIKAAVGAVFYATADKLVPEVVDNDVAPYIAPTRILTICVIVLKNGFTLIGTSAPASAENFDAEKGREFAYENALGKAWPLMGFALRDRLHRDSADAEIYMRATGQNKMRGIPGNTQLKEMNKAPPPIEDDETLESSGDSYIKALTDQHGLEYIDRADAISKLKAKRDSILPSQNAANGGMPNPV